MHFAIGYTEPEAGTDLASLRTTAVRDGDDYVVNGQKIFTTGGHDADYVWLAVPHRPRRPEAQGHLDPHRGHHATRASPGRRSSPPTARTTSTRPTTTTSGCRSSMLVGEENEGWRLITTQLNHERVMLGPAGRIAGLYDRVARLGRRRRGLLDAAGRAPGARRGRTRRPRQRAAQLAGRRARPGDVDVGRRVGHQGLRLRAGAARSGRSLEEIVGRHGDPADPETAALLRWLDVQAKRNLVLTFGGGVNEVQRELIAMSGLGLPRVPAMTEDVRCDAHDSAAATERVNGRRARAPRPAATR